MTNKIVTYTGKIFDLLNPRPEMVCIEDIAHALSNICRYTGHTKRFYSVAQHCVLMASADLPGNPLNRLLHDSAEAYIGDISRPLKHNLVMRCFFDPTITDHEQMIFNAVIEHEKIILDVISDALHFKIDNTSDIKVADNRMMVTEIRDLMYPSIEFDHIVKNYKPLPKIIKPWDAFRSENGFLYTYYALREGKTCQGF